jgi:hypothetical protein
MIVTEDLTLFGVCSQCESKSKIFMTFLTSRVWVRIAISQALWLFASYRDRLLLPFAKMILRSVYSLNTADSLIELHEHE